MKVTAKLIVKAEKAFEGRDMILTNNEGLSRKELRTLERHGIIESKLFRNKDSGMIIRGWRLIKGIIEKPNLDVPSPSQH